MTWPWVSRRAFDLVTAECLRLLDEKRQFLAKIDMQERALLRASSSASAQEYMHRLEPKPAPEDDPMPVEPGPNAPWEAEQAYAAAIFAWEDRHKGKPS